MGNIYILGFGALKWWGLLALDHSAPPPLIHHLRFKYYSPFISGPLSHYIHQHSQKHIFPSIFFSHPCKYYNLATYAPLTPFHHTHTQCSSSYFHVILVFPLNGKYLLSPSVSASISIFRRTLLGYYAERMHANFKEIL